MQYLGIAHHAQYNTFHAVRLATCQAIIPAHWCVWSPVSIALTICLLEKSKADNRPPVASSRLAYYAYAETYRYFTLRKRRSLHAAILHGSSTTQEISESIKARFASLQCLLTGRYLNVSVTISVAIPNFFS